MKVKVQFIEPMLLQPTEKLAATGSQVYELKLNGFRSVGNKRATESKLRSAVKASRLIAKDFIERDLAGENTSTSSTTSASNNQRPGLRHPAQDARPNPGVREAAQGACCLSRQDPYAASIRRTSPSQASIADVTIREFHRGTQLTVRSSRRRAPAPPRRRSPVWC